MIWAVLGLNLKKIPCDKSVDSAEGLLLLLKLSEMDVSWNLFFEMFGMGLLASVSLLAAMQ